MRLGTCLSILALALVFSHSVFAAGASVSDCEKGELIPSSSSLRPEPTAHCGYDTADVQRRILSLVADTHRLYTVETLEQSFKLPPMTSMYDSTRIAAYAMTLDGKGAWKLLVSTDEAFYPLDDAAQKMFVPGLRPRRLHSPKDASLSIDLIFMAASPGGRPAMCLPFARVRDSLQRGGWTDTTHTGAPPTDGGIRQPSFRHDRRQVFIRPGQDGCVNDITLRQDAPEKNQAISR